MITIFKCLGVIAFSVSGALTAIKRKLDWFGIIVLGLTCAFGGGLIRDCFLNKEIPSVFEEWTYLLISLFVTVMIQIPSFKKRIDSLNYVLVVMDTIGLGLFSVIGARTVIAYGNIFYTVFIGTLTAVGGGVIADIFANQKPRIFVSDIYASSCVIGIIVMSLLWKISNDMATLIGAIIIIVIRFIAVKYGLGSNKQE